MKQEYSLSEILANIIFVIYTRLFWKKARLIRKPFYCRGKKYINYGKGLTIGYSCRFETFQKNNISHGVIEIGENCRIGDRVHITACESVKIGDNCLFASNILITDNQHGIYGGATQSSPIEHPNNRVIDAKKVVIGNNVWLGENVVILPGTEIGDGCVVGANSVVNKSIKSGTIAVGSPAIPIKIWSEKERKWVLIKNEIKQIK